MAEHEKQAAIDIISTLRENGHQAYLVGGCVRDLLLGREPADYDVATDASPQKVMRIFPETYAVGVQFGVVLVPLPKGLRTSHTPPPGLNESQNHPGRFSPGSTAEELALSPPSGPGHSHKACV